MKGQLIVIEGTDGAGKATQQKLLVDYFKKQQISYTTFDFPQYYKTFFGKLAGKFLKGEFGDPKKIPPQLISLPYAADRFQVKDDIEYSLAEKNIVLINRYVGSNAAYQSARLPEKEREDFVRWNFEMEYDVFGIPHEDIVLFLYVPLDFSQQLIAQKNNRKYLGKQKDINEANLALMKEVEQVYLNFCKTYRHWVKIECVEKGKLLSKEEIHEKVVEILKKKNMLK